MKTFCKRRAKFSAGRNSSIPIGNIKEWTPCRVPFFGHRAHRAGDGSRRLLADKNLGLTQLADDLFRSEAPPHLSNKYQVYGVPNTIVNDTVSFEGVVPEEEFLENVLKAAK